MKFYSKQMEDWGKFEIRDAQTSTESNLEKRRGYRLMKKSRAAMFFDVLFYSATYMLAPMWHLPDANGAASAR